MEDKYLTFVPRKVPRNRDYQRSRDRDFGSTCANHNRKIIGKEKRQLVTKDSPDYFPPRGAAFYKKWIKRQPAHLDWVVMGLIGFTVGFVGFLLHQLIDLVMDYKWQIANDLIKAENYRRALLWVVGYSLIFALLGSSMVVSLRVFAAGSGIPELIGFLNAKIFRHIFNVKTMAMKFFSCVCAVVSGLTVGPEGPMIYLGGLVGAGLAQMERNPPYFRRFRNPKDRRNFISAGIGAGVASAFGAPVGGFLFAMQNLDVSLCDIRLSSQIFFCTAVATFTTGLFNSVFKNQFNPEGHFGLFKAKRYILFQIDHEVPLHFYVFIPAVILGILGGILGRIFTFINLKIYKFRRYLLGKMRSRRVKNTAHVLEVCSLVVIIGTVSVFLPFPFSCSKYECSFEGPGFDAECLVGHRNALHIERTVSNYACEEGITLMVNGTKYVKGSFNQVATLLFASGEEAIHDLFSRDTHRKFTYGPLLTVLVVYFILACWAAGTAISSGLVVPMLFLGGTCGRIIGKTMVDIFGVHAEGQWAWMDPGAFALIGAASFFGGMPGLTMSLATIMIEITNDTRCLLPILVAMMVSKYIGDLLIHPLFEHYQATDFMSSPVKKKNSPLVDNLKDSHDEDTVKTIYVGGIKESTTKDTISFFFENKKRTGGGGLCEGERGFKRLSPTVARLTFASSKDAKGVLEKGKETTLQLEGNFLTVSSVFLQTHDQSMLLAKNLSPKTNEETFKNFVESTKNADVFNVVLGKDGKAIAILKTAIDTNEDNSENENPEMELDGSIISLEFAPLTKGIKISNMPQGTSPDDIKFQFSNPKIDGGKMTDMMLDRNNDIVIVYFEKSSVVSDLVKKKHTFKDVALTVIPYYDDFEELQESKGKTIDHYGDYSVDPLVMNYIKKTQQFDKKFGFRSAKLDEQASRFYFVKQNDDLNNATVFKNKLEDFLQSFLKEEVKIPKTAFEKVKEEIESKRGEFEADKVDFNLDAFRITLVGKKKDVFLKKQSVEAAIERVSEEAKIVSDDLMVDDRNKLEFLNFINYFENLLSEFPGVQIRGTGNTSGKLSLVGTTEKKRNLKLRIYEDLTRISEIDVKTSVHQIDFLQRTQCKIVNDELKKDDVMFSLVNVEGVVGANALRAKLMTLKKCDDNEKKRLLKIIDTKTSEECTTVDEETATFLTRSDKLRECMKEQFDKHQVLINPEIADPRNIWIVCEKSKMKNAKQALTSLIDENEISSCKFGLVDPMKVRFLREHCWDKIKKKEESCKAEGVVVLDIDANSLEVKGIKAGRKKMMIFLQELARKIDSKTYPLNEPGMKKQMSMDTTDAITVEKNHRCVISLEKNVIEETTSVQDKERFVADTSGSSGMNLPYRFMASVNDKEVNLTSGQRITVVVGDLALQTVDVIVNTTNSSVDLNANPCSKALLRVAGQGLVNECRKTGNLKTGEMASTGPAKLKCKHVYHVRSSSWNNGEGALILRQIIQKCLDELDKYKLKSIAIPAIGTGALNFPRPKVARIFFEEVTSFLKAHPQSGINDVRFVAYDKDQATVDAFLAAVQEIKSTISRSGRISCMIYSDDRKMIEKAWEELRRKVNQNILEKIISDDIIKKFTDRDLKKLTNLEHDYDLDITTDRGKGEIKLKGHILDTAIVEEKVNEILKDIKDNENRVPAYWVETTGEEKYYEFTLSSGSQEYKDVAAAFRATARNQIVSIKRIQNKEIYGLFNLKRQAMLKKYGTNFPSKEKMLFHGTSSQNIEKINSGGLNRSFAGANATSFGRGVYFAREARYSCQQTYSPPDSQGLRYMYYARVLVGDYTNGHSGMIVPPSKNTFDPNETYDSVVDNVGNPRMYILFQDYEYYTEYLITFR